jgi:hypothetical protein
MGAQRFLTNQPHNPAPTVPQQLIITTPPAPQPTLDVGAVAAVSAFLGAIAKDTVKVIVHIFRR